MDFKEIKAKAAVFAKEAKEKVNASIEKGIEKVEESSFVVSDEKELEKIISETKNGTNSYGKISRKRTIVIFSEKGSDFYKNLLSYILPVIYAKAWTQSVGVKLCNLDKKLLKKYEVEEIPALLVFGDTKLIKALYGQGEIEKVVKNLNMDINYLIDNL